MHDEGRHEGVDCGDRGNLEPCESRKSLCRHKSYRGCDEIGGHTFKAHLFKLIQPVKAVELLA
ncbi:hypothetical protein E1963_17640 [Extibacter muris]|uniref:Uncharacterized protein n=1 Tax=Extibacter muris TaxID=1796622 RepID=A0A4R4FAN7_9FIRM|nr:hypothetical protein E1963_17640 [Extibacter muris]